MVQEYARIRLIDAMDKSVKRIDTMLETDAPDTELKKELDLFQEMENTTKKYHIPYSIRKQRQK